MKWARYYADLALSTADNAVAVYNTSADASLPNSQRQLFRVAYQNAPLHGAKASDADLTASLTLHRYPLCPPSSTISILDAPGIPMGHPSWVY